MELFHLALVILAANCATTYGKRGLPKKPHIIFILADDMGWNDISHHGSHIKTPNIDKIFRHGVELNQYYVAPMCGPSRAQLLTGRHLTSMGLQHKNLTPCRPSGIPLNEKTIAQHLAPLGYKSHIVGKWHSGFHTPGHVPTNRGFSTFCGMLNGQADHYNHRSSFKGRGPYLDWNNNTIPSHSDDGVYATYAIEARAKELIDEHRMSGEPMFLYMSYTAPHYPLQAPVEYYERYTNITGHSRRKYAALVSAMDDSIGRVIRKLKVTGMLADSLIVFSSDNGGQALRGASNFPFRGNKGTYYEGGVRAIGAVAGPLIKQTRVMNKLMHITDWVPTLVKVAGGNPKKLKLDGVDQWNVIANNANSKRKEIVYNIDPLDLFGDEKYRKWKLDRVLKNRKGFNSKQLAAIRRGPWKLLTGRHHFNLIIPDPDGQPLEFEESFKIKSKTIKEIQLFNVLKDPTESQEVSWKHPDVVKRLLQRLEDYSKTTVKPFYPPSNNLCDPALNGGAWGPYIFDQ